MVDNTDWTNSMSTRVNGMRSSISKADNDASFGREYEKRLHKAMYDDRFRDKNVPSSEVTPNDVLGGQGRGPMDHSGSQSYRNTVDFYKEEYSDPSTTPHGKWIIRCKVINEVLSRDGRFLSPCLPEKKCWKIIEYAEVHRKIKTRIWDKDKPPRSVKGNAVQRSPKDVMTDLYRSRLPDQDNFTLDDVEFTPDLNKAISDVDEADWREHLAWLASSI